MSVMNHGKVTAEHLEKNAYLYVRQSTIRQVFENAESTKRQYALKERAIALGWPLEKIIIIDDDLGKSGARSVDRAGFQRLVTEVGLGNSGVVMGLEVSRLARNSADWHRLIEICALSNTLILDEDGIYNPSDFNDRLILGLKGTMSEAELHMLKSRLQGGIISKAKRGELQSPLPTGLVYNQLKKVELDPDIQIQETLATFFKTFDRTGSAMGVVRYFQKNDIKFPRRIKNGARKGELSWNGLTHFKALHVLHNPRYAGAFSHGRTKQSKLPGGSQKYKSVPQADWIALIKDAHPGYITWAQYEANEKKLKDNSQAYGHDRRRSPPREGPALLQGLLICGRCGQRMTLRYYMRKGKQVPDYNCQKLRVENAQKFCQRVPGEVIDDRISKIILESVTPLTIDVALQVQKEIELRSDEVIQLQEKKVERARYEADNAQARYMKVDPNNRLVADTLEADWNSKLKYLDTAQENYEKDRKQKQFKLDEEKRREILSLASDFPKLWNDPKTSHKEKKRIVRLVIEDVTISRGDGINVDIRFRGGATESFILPIPKPAWAIRKTSKEVVDRIDRLLQDYSPAEIAGILNEEGRVTGMGLKFSRTHVHQIRMANRLKSRRSRMKEQGLLSAKELGIKLDVCPSAITRWGRIGVLQSFSDGKEKLYPTPDSTLIARLRAFGKQGRRSVFLETLTDRLNEVQYEV